MTCDAHASSLSFSYNFSPRETALLAHFFREKQEDIPEGLADFAYTVEKAMYSSMSINDAEKFYS
ncbi:MAG: hypothetical protein IJR50_01465 [Treponema sp.]|nr:hypothetical protein [Treponema sp.]